MHECAWQISHVLTPTSHSQYVLLINADAPYVVSHFSGFICHQAWYVSPLLVPLPALMPAAHLIPTIPAFTTANCYHGNAVAMGYPTPVAAAEQWETKTNQSALLIFFAWKTGTDSAVLARLVGSSEAIQSTMAVME